MGIRFDGVYISKQPVDFEMYAYVRFYEDGTVIGSDIRGIPPATTLDAFNTTNCRYKGRYWTDGHYLKSVFPVSAEFSGSGQAFTVEEEGQIVGDELHVHHISYGNNFSYEEEYKFWALNPKLDVEGDNQLLASMKILGIDGTLSEQKIKDAYRKAIAKYHPDKVQHLGDEFKQLAGERATEINDAYEFLRKKYSFQR